jgi:Putative Flp pilus-assembly TadE/G-like
VKGTGKRVRLSALRKQGRQQGQAALLVVGLALVCFAVAGVAVDGTRAFLLRRTLQNAADASALAGAAELDHRAYYRSSGRRVLLDPEAARRMAGSWLERRGLQARFEIEADTAGVGVQVRRNLPTTFLGLAGIRRIPVAAQAWAEPIAAPP